MLNNKRTIGSSFQETISKHKFYNKFYFYKVLNKLVYS